MMFPLYVHFQRDQKSGSSLRETVRRGLGQKQGFLQHFAGCIGNSRPNISQREHSRHQDQQGQRFGARTNNPHEDQWCSVLTNRTGRWKGGLGSHYGWFYKSSQGARTVFCGQQGTSGRDFVVDWLVFIFNDAVSIIDKISHSGVKRDLKKHSGVAMS